ncbi:hypothetical protein WG66_002906 [Moniliophthora roreri]|nr:hypothetical protein WG66_002906 [Moniliophthora roreri]
MTALFVLGLLSKDITASAKLQTATIDDEDGDSVTGAKPTFLPAAGGFWQGSKCDSSCGYPECQGCGLSIDPKRAYKGTWRVATHRVGDPTDFVQIEFVGTEVGVFCIVPSPQGNITTQYELTFVLDKAADESVWSPDATTITETRYGERVFYKNNLDSKKHTLIVKAESMRFDTVFLFDYATYVYDDGQVDDGTPTSITRSPTSSPESSTSQLSSVPTSSSTTPSFITPSFTPPSSSATPSPTTSLSSTTRLPSSVTSTPKTTEPLTTPFSRSSVSGSPSTADDFSASTLPSQSKQQSSDKASSPSRQLIIILATVVATTVCLCIAIFISVYRFRRGRTGTKKSSISPQEAGTSSVAGIRSARRRSAQSASSQSTVEPPDTEEAPPPPYNTS